MFGLEDGRERLGPIGQILAAFEKVFKLGFGLVFWFFASILMAGFVYKVWHVQPTVSVPILLFLSILMIADRFGAFKFLEDDEEDA